MSKTVSFYFFLTLSLLISRPVLGAPERSKCTTLLTEHVMPPTDDEIIALGTSLHPLLEAPAFSELLFQVLHRSLGIPSDRVRWALEWFPRMSHQEQQQLIGHLINHVTSGLPVIDRWNTLTTIGADWSDLAFKQPDAYDIMSRTWHEWTSTPERRAILGAFLRIQLLGLRTDSPTRGVWIDRVDVIRHLTTKIAAPPIRPSRQSLWRDWWMRVTRNVLNAIRGPSPTVATGHYSPSQLAVETLEPTPRLPPSFETIEQELAWLEMRIDELKKRIQYIQKSISEAQSAYYQAQREIRMLWEHHRDYSNRENSNRTFISLTIERMTYYQPHLTTAEFLDCTILALRAWANIKPDRLNHVSPQWRNEKTKEIHEELLHFFNILHELFTKVFFENREQLQQLTRILNLYKPDNGPIEIGEKFAEVLNRVWGAEAPTPPEAFVGDRTVLDKLYAEQEPLLAQLTLLERHRHSLLEAQTSAIGAAENTTQTRIEPDTSEPTATPIETGEGAHSLGTAGDFDGRRRDGP